MAATITDVHLLSPCCEAGELITLTTRYPVEPGARG